MCTILEIFLCSSRLTKKQLHYYYVDIFASYQTRVAQYCSIVLIQSREKFGSVLNKNFNKIRVLNHNIEYNKNVKYLSVTLDTKLNFTKLINKKRGEAFGMMNHLRPLLNCKSPLNINNKRIPYLTLLDKVYWNATNNRTNAYA